MSKNRASIERRVHEAATAVFEKKQIVAPIDILIHAGFVTEKQVTDWRHGRIPYLKRVTNAGLGTLTTAMAIFRKWATNRGLRPSVTAYRGLGKCRGPLQFSKFGDPKIEKCYSTHYLGQTQRVRPGPKSEAAIELKPTESAAPVLSGGTTNKPPSKCPDEHPKTVR